jgi:hypothetical protein
MCKPFERWCWGPRVQVSGLKVVAVDAKLVNTEQT